MSVTDEDSLKGDESPSLSVTQITMRVEITYCKRDAFHAESTLTLKMHYKRHITMITTGCDQEGYVHALAWQLPCASSRCVKFSL